MGSPKMFPEMENVCKVRISENFELKESGSWHVHAVQSCEC